ncbi:MAG TPA: hydrogenase maturation protease [Terriglobia bacterium]|nr:hydrogenase maturation protease [Terriglobia bacterium]
MRVFGLGNEFRRDDAIGRIAVRRLSEQGIVTEEIPEPVSLMHRWRGAGGVVLLDAIVSGRAPGSILSFDASVEPLPRAQFSRSTHAFGLADAVELSRALGDLPRRVMVFGLEGADFSPGAGLSPAVRQAMPAFVAEVASYLHGRS